MISEQDPTAKEMPRCHVQDSISKVMIARGVSSFLFFFLSSFFLLSFFSTTLTLAANANANNTTTDFTHTNTHITMNWLKTKMGSHGWDINDDDIKKPNVLFLTPIKFARQELEDFEEYFTVKVTTRPSIDNDTTKLMETLDLSVSPTFWEQHLHRRLILIATFSFSFASFSCWTLDL